MSLQNVIYLSDLTGTFSSGVLPTIYTEPWKRQGREDTNTPLEEPKLPEPVNTTAGLDVQISLLSDTMDIFYPDITTRMTSWWNVLQFQQQAESIAAYVITTKPQKLIETSKWWDTSQISWPERLTTANVDLETLHNTIIQFKQRLELSERFDLLAQRQDNWDGYESKKPTTLTLNHARHLMEELFNSIISEGYPWLTPFISSDEDGYITAEWYEKGRQLHIQIGENETEYLQVWGINIDTEMREGFLSHDNYLMLWEWLLNG